MLPLVATKKRKNGGNGGAHDDAVVVELKRIFEEMQAEGARAGARAEALTGRVDVLTGRVDALASEVRAQGMELRAVRDLLVDAVARDHRRIDTLEVRVGALEAGKH